MAAHQPDDGPSADLTGAVVLRVNERSDQLYLVYTGLAQHLTIEPMRFFEKTRLLDRNVAMFKDRSARFYQHGIAPGIETFESFLEWQRCLCVRLPQVRRLFCLGTSMGGYAAILFGYLLRAEAVWAFGPQTRLDGVLVGADQLPRSRRDLRALLATGNSVTKYNVYYNRSHRGDVLAALRLAGSDGVSLWPQPGQGHAVINSLIETDRLSSLLPEPT